MNVLLTADLHLSDKPTERYRHDFMAHWLPDAIKRNKADALLLLGDLTEQKDRHAAGLVNSVVSHIAAIANSLAPVVVLCGNHDYRRSDCAFFEFLKQVPNVTWVGAVTRGSELRHAALANVLQRCLFLPHTFDYKREWAAHLSVLDQYRYVFAHNTFNGANVGFGRKVEGIPLTAIKDGARVISGDIHVPQKLGPVRYVGAPYTVDFGDDYASRVLLLDIDKRKLTSIDTSTLPQKRLVEFANVDAIGKQRIRSINQGDVVKLRVHVDSLKDWSSVSDKLTLWAVDHGAVLARVEPIITKAKTKRGAVRLDTRQTDAQVFDKFCKLQKVPPAVREAGRPFIEVK